MKIRELKKDFDFNRCAEKRFHMMRHYIQISAIVAMLLLPIASHAVDEAACAKVSLEIVQGLTTERVAFDARMIITNNLPDKDLTDIRVDVMLRNLLGELKNDLFFIKLTNPEYGGISDGTGVVKAGTRAEIHWLIIPSPGAGGESPTGIKYEAGAMLAYTVAEKRETVPISPDTITVRPEAQLVLDYFTPFQVIGDNPFTVDVEPPVPFELALRVMNDGYGTANKLKIESAQPKIVENEKGLLVDFQLLGASVNDGAVNPSLTVDIGNVASKTAATAYWEMMSTLSGRFEEFDVSFTHSDDLGGQLTSLIRETNAHYLVHRVRANQANRDNLLDFLADTDRDGNHLPDTLFESEIPGDGTEMADARSPVYVVQVTNSPERPTVESPSVMVVTANPSDAGWTYVTMPDPSGGMLELLNVVRIDGTPLDPHNFWVDKKLDSDYKEVFDLQFIDYRESSILDGRYTLVYEQPLDDFIPPLTRLVLDGYYVSDDPLIITTSTRVVFTATDNEGGSGVEAMYAKVSGRDVAFVSATPFNFSQPRNYIIELYSVDMAGNMEEVKSVSLIVDDTPPLISSFMAEPEVIVPHAPEGISAARSLDLKVIASDNVETLPLTIEIALGETFLASAVVRTIKGELTKDVEGVFAWDGKGDDGKLVSTGKYTARVTVRDGLGDESDIKHFSTQTTAIEVAQWFAGEDVAGTGEGEQMHPAISGTRVAWQDNRNGNWDIYYKDLPGGAETLVTSDVFDQSMPDVYGGRIVWQDARNDDGDIYGYDTATEQEFAICTDGGSQERPVISGDWVAWQDYSAGNWDIYAYNFSTMEKIRITSHERDQMHPAIEGSTILWQDYRHGLGEIYGFDLDSSVETRLTNNIDNQTSPVLSGNIYVWTDHRNGGRDLYLRDAEGNETRVTYGAGDEADADIKGGTIVYTDFTNGLDDPNLAFYDMTTGLGGILNANPARQEEAAIGDGYVAWQDNRTGNYRIYVSDFEVVAVPLKATIKPGLNLIAVGGEMTSQYPSVSAFVGAYGDSLGIDKVLTLDALHGTYREFEYDGIATSGEDFALTSGMALLVYASKDGVVTVAESGEAVSYTLLPGANEIGILSVPLGYKAYDLMTSIGLDKIQSVRRFNTAIGSWETAAVERSGETGTLVGINFDVKVGEGLAITMIERVDGWKP